VAPIALSAVFVFCIGLCVGSFLNVAVYRLPREMSLVRPGSHCPCCNEAIAWYDNIPVLSWLSLGGLCRRCGVLISPRYLLVELLTAGLFLVTYLARRSAVAAGADVPLAHLPAFGAYLVLSAALIVSAFVDLERYVIPDEVSVGGMCLGPVLCALWPDILPHDRVLTGWVLGLLGATGSAPLAGFAASVIGMALGATAVYVAGALGRVLFRKEAMGLGDVKLMGMVGAFLGWPAAVLTFFVACIYGAVVALALLVRRRDTHIPFGPYLAAGALTMMLGGEHVRRLLPEALALLLR